MKFDYFTDIPILCKIQTVQNVIFGHFRDSEH